MACGLHCFFLAVLIEKQYIYTFYLKLFLFISVIALKGVPYRSGPIRIRAKNGAWVTTKTEWSSFVNPWTKRLEFIIGKHTVVK